MRTVYFIRYYYILRQTGRNILGHKLVRMVLQLIVAWPAVAMLRSAVIGGAASLPLASCGLPINQMVHSLAPVSPTAQKDEFEAIARKLICGLFVYLLQDLSSSVVRHRSTFPATNAIMFVNMQAQRIARLPWKNRWYHVTVIALTYPVPDRGERWDYREFRRIPPELADTLRCFS